LAKPLRRERVTELVHHELGDIIQREVRDPRLGWVTVTRVEMSPDLCYAKVFVSLLGGDEHAQRQSLRILERAGAFIRTELGRRVRLRQTPELHFKLDHSLEHSQRVMEILNEIRISPASEASAGDSAGAAAAEDGNRAEDPGTASQGGEAGSQTPDGTGGEEDAVR
jgi:ribosome-binding factor A